VEIEPQIFFGKVMHGRLFPKRNNFTYGIYYLSLPVSKIKNTPIAYNRFAALSFYDRDHGLCDGSSLEEWARKILNDYKVEEANGEIKLICMPRVLNYVFNPVSFWLCNDKEGKLRAVLCEVHNTFGERHTYICAHEDHRPISHKDTLKGDKIFHVSPLLKREGHYIFRFDLRDDKFAVWIDFYNDEGKKQLVTSLIGDFEGMTTRNLNKAFWSYPLITLKATTLIHWQALKLLAKGIKYISRPEQKTERVSATENLTKM
jgi:DUF1365 family protein